MKLPRRQFLHLAAGAAALPAVSRVARAQAYPARQVRVIVGYAAGGGTDIFVRLIGQLLSDRLGQSFVVENRPGAGTNLATEGVVRLPPDGYTLLGVDSAAAVNVSMYDKLNFDFVRDFVVIGMVRGPLIMAVHPSVPASTVTEFVAYAKANPGKVTMGSAGAGGPGHVTGELFQMATGVKMVHVPYRGAAPATIDLLGGQVQVLFPGPPSVIDHIRAGRLHALAVTTATRLEALPNVPTMSDFVPGFEASIWYAVCVRQSTPADIVKKLNGELNRALADTKIMARLTDLGMIPFAASSPDLTTFVSNETEKWGKVIRAGNIKPE